MYRIIIHITLTRTTMLTLWQSALTWRDRFGPAPKCRRYRIHPCIYISVYVEVAITTTRHASYIRYTYNYIYNNPHKLDNFIPYFKRRYILFYTLIFLHKSLSKFFFLFFMSYFSENRK